MAQGVLALLSENPEFELLGVVSRSQPVDPDGCELAGFNWFSCLQEIDAKVDLLIDFTLTGGPGSAAKWCEQHGVALLSGTTGLSDGDKRALQKAALSVPVLSASNLSFGIALMTSLVRQAAAALGADASITISDIHHKHKLDAPSGTALTLATAAMEAAGDNDDGEVGFISVRQGEVIGEHTVSFELAGETIDISHKAFDRGVFAAGALKAGAWLVKQPPGYYTPTDWLAL